ncbi:protein XNDC1N isoform X2 [Paramisgurnus dabryanus]|uniref:protein XNDC1N isoform X2 n=1 Tax=Paramisgurnus dabryanus TaxID=90735 RepID=UPI0031F36084
MAPVRIKHIVSFTSQDIKNGVDNLCDSSENSRPWLCSAQDRSGVLRVELQMERASAIGFLDVGNCGSAFIQVDVGRSSWSLDHPYVTLLPTATLMNPADARQGTGRQTVRMFKKADFLHPAAEESWDRLRVTCTQPFNKHSQFGLSFLRVRTKEDQTEDISGQQEALAPQNMHTPDKMTSVKEWLSSPAVQNTYFGRIAGGVRNRDASPDAKRSPESLSWAGRMVIAARSNRRSLSTSPNSSTSSTTPQRDNSISTESSRVSSSTEEVRTPEEHKRKSKARQCLVNNSTALKRSRSTASTHKTISSSSARGVKTEKRACKPNERPVDTQEPASPAPQISTDLVSPETMCPLCGVSFSPDYLPLHASTCMESDPAEVLEVMETGAMSSRQLPVFGSGADELMVPCPLCSIRFPPDRIQQHASTCGDTVEPSIVWLD